MRKNTVDRSIRTYHARRGRVAGVAAVAMQELLPRYGIEAQGDRLDLAQVFGGEVPVVLEFGAGMGEATIAMARDEPGVGIVAVEVHTPGVSRLLRGIDSDGIANVRVVHGDGIALLHERIPPQSLAGFRAFFPDPWPKARHHKRRLIRPELVRLIASRMQSGAVLQLATDWDDYAEQMLAVLDAEPAFVVRNHSTGPERLGRPATKFERKGQRQGHTIHDIVAERLPSI